MCTQHRAEGDEVSHQDALLSGARIWGRGLRAVAPGRACAQTDMPQGADEQHDPCRIMLIVGASALHLGWTAHLSHELVVRQHASNIVRIYGSPVGTPAGVFLRRTRPPVRVRAEVRVCARAEAEQGCVRAECTSAPAWRFAHAHVMHNNRQDSPPHTPGGHCGPGLHSLLEPGQNASRPPRGQSTCVCSPQTARAMTRPNECTRAHTHTHTHTHGTITVCERGSPSALGERAPSLSFFFRDMKAEAIFWAPLSDARTHARGEHAPRRPRGLPAGPRDVGGAA